MTNAELYIRSRQPLYMQAAGQIRLKVENGDWLPGDQIPVIEVLQAEFGLSRATIREALDVLEGEGLIERYRGKGTFVRAQLPERRSYGLPTTWKDLVTGLENVSPKMIAPIAREEGERIRDVQAGEAHGGYMRFERVHSRGEEPYCLIDIFLREDVFETDRERFQSAPVIRVLVERHGERIATARQRVTFSIADERTANALGVALGAPVVEILRTIADGEGRVVAHTHARYPGEYVRLDFDFNIAEAGPAALSPTEE